ncbi:MAG: FliH/SctL family protein [Pseudomonadota bacterium]
MANSSDWIEQVGALERAQPDWIAALGGREGFQPGSPFATAHRSPPVETSPLPAEPQQTDAIARAFAEGEAAGRAAAEADAKAEMERQRELRLTFRAFDQAALDSLASELSETVVALCEQVLEASALDRDGLIERCQWAARRIGSGASQATLHLHPEDIAMLGNDALADWEVRADPAMLRGSLLLESPDGAVRDGPAEWRRAIAEAVRG